MPVAAAMTMTQRIEAMLAAGLRFVPAWLITFVLFALAAGAALFVHRFVFRLLKRLVADQDLFWRSLVSRLEGLLRLGMVVLAIALVAGLAPLTRFETGVVRHLLLICFFVLVAWAARIALHIWVTVYQRRFKLDAEDNLLARKHVTQMRVLERVGNVLLVVLGLSAILMTFEEVRQYGVSLLASAGAAGLIAGLALQPVLKNLFAGIQLAITQPIRIDDALLVEGEWGNVEEITSTYVVVRIWDWRRLVLPLSYFIENPFQNWTRESSALIGNVMLYLDHTAPIETIRKKAEEIVADAPQWDGKVINTQVTDIREQVIEVRVLATARNSGNAFELRCLLRERLVAFLVAEHPHALPRRRADIDSFPEQATVPSPASTTQTATAKSRTVPPAQREAPS